jgi:hypothetical protein
LVDGPSDGESEGAVDIDGFLTRVVSVGELDNTTGS